MDELWTRIALVAGALVLAGLIALWQRSRSRKPSRDIHAPGLDPGVYLFSSSACPTCARARRAMEARLGDGFEELSWEEEPGIFAELGIDAVPAVVALNSDRRGTLRFGQPPRSLLSR